MPADDRVGTVDLGDEAPADLRHAQLRPLLQRLRQSAVANNGGGGGAAALLGELGGWLDAASAAVELSLEQAHHAAAWLLHVSAR